MSSNDFFYYYNNTYPQPGPPDWKGPTNAPNHAQQRRYFNNKQHFHAQRRYNNSNQFITGPGVSGQSSNPNANGSANWPGRKRTGQEMEPMDKTKPPKKKKKAGSQNQFSNKKDWTLEEAQAVLNLEREYSKRHKNLSLIIKFPDLELNKEIVSEFHQAIEHVHFQHPSTARFCFVTLKDSSDVDSVISSLNKVKFGNGFLTAEHKRDREDDQTIRPEDIDPFTLYVGNLAHEVTKENITKTYPNCRRIDIGYAKKLKNTRYAFVSFKTIADSMEAFKNTHSIEMHSKSLIVRFRRLHGTAAMPGGETRQFKQNLQKEKHTEPEIPEDITELIENGNEIKNERSGDNPDEVVVKKEQQSSEEGGKGDSIEKDDDDKARNDIDTHTDKVQKDENHLHFHFDSHNHEHEVSCEAMYNIANTDGADSDDDSLELNDVLNFSL